MAYELTDEELTEVARLLLTGAAVEKGGDLFYNVTRLTMGKVDRTAKVYIVPFYDFLRALHRSANMIGSCDTPSHD